MTLVLCVITMVGVLSVDASDRIYLTNGTIDITEGFSRLPQDWIDTTRGTGYYLVHFDGIITPEWRKELDRYGTVTSYLPHNTYVVRIDSANVSAIEGLAHVDWVGLYQPYFKFDPFIFKQTPEKGFIKLRVTLFSGEAFEPVSHVVNTYGGLVISRIDQPHRRRIVALVPEKTLYQSVRDLSFERGVEWIQSYPDYQLCNNDTQWICQSGPYQGGLTPLYDRGILGAGQIVGVMDTGADPDMCFFYDSAQGLIEPNVPNFDQRKIVAYIGPSQYADIYDQQGHGTHTAGTIAGDNFANPGGDDIGDGIAPLAKLIIHDYGDAFDVHPPDDQYSAQQDVYDLGGRVHSNSWGWPGNAGIYHDDCQEVDQFIWDNPTYSMVYAAGNEGSSANRIRPPGTSKNVITVGATQHGTADPESMESFSSHGPTHDGRIKPDVALPGGGIISASNDSNPNSFNCDTRSLSGTSMATPGVAGCAALIRDYFMQGFYPLGMPDSAFAFEPSAALVKAVMINSGVNMTGAYTGDVGSDQGDIPSMGQGWGRVTLDTALYFQDDTKTLFVSDNETGILGARDTVQYHVAVSSSDEPLTITLVWSDFPSTPQADINLVNDLDLTVTIDGTTYLGNVYEDGQSVTGGSPDRLNNVECVQLNEPPIGAYTITITGHNVPQGPQSYALVVTGALNFSDGVVSLNSDRYACSATATITVADADIASQGTQDVTVISTSDPDGETIILTEIGDESGVFQGTVELTTNTPGAGQIQVAHDDVITVTYIDADDGQGNQNIPKTATAIIDCVPPEISNVAVSWITSDTAQITWLTDEPANSIVTYGMSAPPVDSVTNNSLVTSHLVILQNLDECTDYIFSVSSADKAGNTATDDNSGSYYAFTTHAVYVLLEETMDTDPGWTYENQWEWGPASGIGGNPPSGHTGTHVVGYNLTGNYQNSLPPTYMTTTPFDCSGASQAYLSFWRWLGVESATWDHAAVEISNDGGSTWHVVWQHSGSTIQETEWSYQEYDISDQAAGQSDVRLRWVMGPTDSIISYFGWNIDDVMVSYTAPCNAPNLIYEDHTIDDSAGNNDGQINGGEDIAMTVTLKNLGLDATDVSATLTTTNSNVTITNSMVTFPDILQNGAGTSNEAFEFSVATSVTDGEQIPFTITWDSDGNMGTTSFSEMIVAPNLMVSDYEIEEVSGGTFNGIWEPGETILIKVTAANIGYGMAHNVSGILSSSHSEYVTIEQDTTTWPNIPGGESAMSNTPFFRVTASPDMPDPTTVEFTVDFTADGYTADSTFEIDCTFSNFVRRYFWNMDTDPEWTTENQWEWGVPGGTSGNPSSGYTGDNVYGYNLQGSYTNNMPETNLTSTAIDCSGLVDVEVRFMRWLGVENSIYDNAHFRVSNDGVNWVNIWSHDGASFTDPDWVPITYDISAVADNESMVYLRWVMGTTDGSVVYCGWNIDDVEIWADSDTATPTPTPAPPTATPTATPTSAPPTNTPAPPTQTPTPDCINHGDVNFDGLITAADAQLAFQIAIGQYIPTYEEECAADCNGDGVISAGDAQQIFLTALGSGSCVDPIPDKFQFAFMDDILSSNRLIQNQTDTDGWISSDVYLDDDVYAEIMLHTRKPIDALTLYVVYDPERYEFIEGTTGTTDPGWEMFGVHEPIPGLIIIAAFAIDNYIEAEETGSIAQLQFHPIEFSADVDDVISFVKLLDDLSEMAVN
jgi:hypothetical protein